MRKLLLIFIFAASAYGQTAGLPAPPTVPPSGDSVACAKDTANLNAAITTAEGTGLPIKLAQANYYINSLATITSPITFQGTGAGTVINFCPTTGNAFTLAYSAANANVASATEALFSDFTLQEKVGVTPSAGHGFDLSNGGSGYLTNVHIERVSFAGLWQPFYLGTGLFVNWIKDVWMSNCISNIGLEYNTPSPGGDLYGNNISATASSTACNIQIDQGDTSQFTNLKLNNGAYVHFTDVATAGAMRFINTGVENFGSCAFDFGTGPAHPTNVQIVGGGIGVSSGTALCNTGQASGLAYIFNDYATGDGNPGLIGAGWTWKGVFNGIGLSMTAPTGQGSTFTSTDAGGTGASTLTIVDGGANGLVEQGGPNFAPVDSTTKGMLFIASGTNGNGIVFSGNANVVSGGTTTIDFRPGGVGSAARSMILDKSVIHTTVPISLEGSQTVSGCTLSSAVGGSMGGKFASGTTGTCTVTITPGITATNGLGCIGSDSATHAIMTQSGLSQTTCVITGSTTSGDAVTWTVWAF